MNSHSLAKLLDPIRMRQHADVLAILVAVSMPWSTSATGILIALWLVALLPTLDIAGLRRELATPAGALPVLFVALGALGILWSDAAWWDRLRGFAPFVKLLFIPLLFFAFRRSDLGIWALRGFLASCALKLLLSWIFVIWPALTWRWSTTYGVPVNDYIGQSGEFLLCAFAVAHVALDLFRQRRHVEATALSMLSAAFLSNIFYVAAARTALVILPILLILFGLRHFSWKGMAGFLTVGIVSAAVVWTSSSYLRERVINLEYEYQVYATENAASSTGERLTYWKKSLGFIAEAPVIGHGTGSIGKRFEQAAVGQTGVLAEAPRNPHNQTFAVAIQLGLIGVAVLFAMWLSHLLLFREPGLVAWIGLMVVVQNVIGSLFNSHLFDFTQGWLYVFGVGIAGGMLARQSANAESQARNQMIRLPKLTSRQFLIVTHDLLATAVAILASFFIRFEAPGLVERLGGIIAILPGFMLYAGVVYYVFGLYKAKWRFASLPDLRNIFRASTVLALSLLVLDYILVTPGFYGTFFFGKITIALYWFLQMFFLGGPRVAYRYFRYSRTRHHAQASESVPILVLGVAADVEVLLRAIESGAVKKIWPVGILSPSDADRGQAIRGIAVLGSFDDLGRTIADLAERGIRVDRLVLTPSAFAPEVKPEAMLMQARRLGLSTSRLPSLDEGSEALRLAPVVVEDLLLRPSVKIDYRRLENFVQGKSIVVTGGGGSIGAEICDRIVTFGAARLLVIENSEPALHAVIETLATKDTGARVEGRLADVRDRDRVFRLLEDFKPDIVFHAAALKHVPLLERDWGEGIKTNVFGTVNVADAAIAAGAGAMVMISTDKAIEPVSVLGATKRFAEMYCQALDSEHATRSTGDRVPMRLIAVRFGNVLASNGSVVPKFKAQIEAGGPITVTHPDMVRYFMTIREACDLVITAASHALDAARMDVSVYVLNMGQPVKIVDLAERMIRIAGLEPGHDIDIVFTGLRPGERLHEILFAREEPSAEIGIPGIVAAKPVRPSLNEMRGWLAALEQGLDREERAAIFRVLSNAVPDFRGEVA